MINSIKKLFQIGGVVLFSLMVTSCESDIDNLGSQFFDGNSAEGTETSYSITAYNINHGDFIRTDAAKLGYATLGAFNEDVFGGQKSDYYTQVRLSNDKVDFGTNAKLDSAVLVINPIYQKDSAVTVTKEFNYPAVNGVAAKQDMVTYPIEKYGKTKINGKTVFNIKVEEVADFLGGINDSIMSNKSFAVSTLIGSKVFDGTVSSVKITKKEDSSELLSRDANLRIKLDSTFFANKIIAKSGKPELSDAASFIRYFKGIKISVAENDGYIFKISPSDMTIQLYYKNDKTENNVVTRPQSTFVLNLGSSNVHFNHIAYNRAGKAYETAMPAISNDQNNPIYPGDAGSSQLFLQGMGGASAGIRIPAVTINSLKKLFNDEKAGIINAKIRLYTDTSIWKNKYKKPSYFLVREKNASSFLTDMTAYSFTPYNLIKTFDTDKELAYYDINITKTIKNIVETNAENKDLIIDLGSYLSDPSTGALLGTKFNDRAYTPTRIVLEGTAKNDIGGVVKDSHVAQLKVTYAKK